MSLLTITELKNRFLSGDRPTQKDYSDMIDTLAGLISDVSTSIAWPPGSAFFYAVANLTGNKYSATYSPAITALVDGGLVMFKAQTENPSGGTTFDCGLGELPIVRNAGLDILRPLQRGDIQPSQVVELRYDNVNTVWRMTSPTSRGSLRTGDIITSSALLSGDYHGSFSPRLLCDGASYLKADYPDLAVACGTTYGAGDSTHFVIPDYRVRFPLGAGPGTVLPTSGNPVNLGLAGGQDRVALTSGEQGVINFATAGLSVTHDVGGAPVIANLGVNGTPYPGGDGVNTSNAVAAVAAVTAHNNMPPWIGAYYYILT